MRILGHLGNLLLVYFLHHTNRVHDLFNSGFDCFIKIYTYIVQINQLNIVKDVY